MLLLDGLDEFEGGDAGQQDLIDLLDFIVSKNTDVKICVSSRPSIAYKLAFEAYPQVCLEDMNSNDMHLYIRDKLCSNRLYQRLEQRDPGLTDVLVG